MKKLFIAAAVAVFAHGAPIESSAQSKSGQAPVEWPGRRPDGSVLLPNMWSLRPAGRQINLGDFPVNMAVHPEGRFAAILHCGYGPHEIIVVDVLNAGIISRTRVDEAFYGLEFSHSGGRLYCSGASCEVVRVFEFADGELVNPQEIRLRDVKERGIPAGMAVSTDSQTLYVANVWGQRVTRVDLMARTNLQEVVVGAGGEGPAPRFESKGSVDLDTAAVTKRAEAALDPASPEAPFPYACRLDEKRNRLYVSLWARAEVAVVDLKSNRVIARWPTGDHPNEMLLTRASKLLYVANANRNTVTVIDTERGRTIETIWAALYPASPPGSTPMSLALSPDEKTLFVANACNNTVAVVDVGVRGKSRPMGFIPVGWYPTSVRVTPDGKKLLVTNGKGITSLPNPNGPQPGRKLPIGSVLQYIGGLFKGTLSVIDLPKRGEFESQLEGYTATAYRCSPLKRDNGVSSVRPANNPVPGKVGDPSPIKYCIYVVKENRTYDQVLGDMPEGNGDAKLCLFGDQVTPNHHKLAREFVLLDNFYVESEVSADGHEWTMGANASDFVEKFWPLSYGHARSKKYPYPAEGNFPVASAPGGYLWDRAQAAGVSYRVYGEFVNNGKTPADPVKSRVKSLDGHIDPWYHGFDLEYPDQKRADRFLSELKRFEAAGEMPRLQIVRLGNDHTLGTSLGKLTPSACVADNDLALGRVIEGVSQSRFWAQTAIFVVEDDAQNGPDHVDAHRTIAFVVSPWTRHGAVDSTMYSTSSMLRTIELILGMQPMTQFDAAATPMFNSFQSKPESQPYAALPATTSLTTRNGSTAWGWRESNRMDFSKEDAADDLRLNEVIWRSVRGANSPMPAPVRAAFVFPHAKKDVDD